MALGSRNWLGGLPALLALSFACTNQIDGTGQPNGAAGTVEGGSAGDSGAGGSSSGSGGSSKGGSGAQAGSSGAAGAPSECVESALADQPLRRLSSSQYHHALRDLFGEELAAPLVGGSLFPETLYTAGFETDAEVNTVNTSESNAIEDNAARIAAAVLDDADSYLRELMPCSLPSPIADADIDDCVGEFVESFGLRAFRRPLATSEAAIATGLYDTVRSEQSAREAFAAVVQWFVEAPALLYRVERGAGEIRPGVLRLDDYEMATRLSFFFLGSGPDQELLDAAAEGRLSEPEQVAEQARRLLESPAWLGVLAGFHRDWLGLEALPSLVKDGDLFPDFDDSVRASMIEESDRFVRHVLENGDGRLETLLSSTSMPLNATLADYYGESASGASATNWVVVDSDRSGLLTQGAFMAASAHPDKTSPIHRGAFLQREVLCNTVAPVPANIDTQGPLESTADRPTARERLAPLMERSDCAGCHSVLNPPGFAFEVYDAAGRYRDQENGADIDPSGSVEVDGDVVEFASAAELVGILSESTQVRDCYSLQWYRFASGRRELPEDACSVRALQAAAASSDGDLRELLVALTQTDGFLYRAAP